MNAVVFPFLLLPDKVQVVVFDAMRLMEIVSFSFCSERAKSLVIPLELTALFGFYVLVGAEITICISCFGGSFRFEFYVEHDDDDEFIQIPTPDYAHVEYMYQNEGRNATEYAEWRRPEYEMKDWVQHLLAIFGPKRVQLQFASRCRRFNTQSVADALKGPRIDELKVWSTNDRVKEASRMALEVFHNSEGLEIMGENPYEDRCSLRKMFLRNYTALLLRFPVGLEELTMINSSDIQLMRPSFSQNDLNRFLKLWIRGSNPRLEHFGVDIWGYGSADTILKDINYTRVPFDPKRRLGRLAIISKRPFMSIGGCDIIRYDGRVATIQFVNRMGSCTFLMHVWSQ